MHGPNTQSNTPDRTIQLRRLARRIYALAIKEHRTQAWYQWPSDAPIPQPVSGIHVYRQNDLPSADIMIVLSKWLGRVSWAILLNRIKRGKGQLLCVMDDGELSAYTLIADMSCYYKYRQIAPRGWMIGPCFTCPEKRRRGYYRQMLDHALHCTVGSDGRPAYIFATDTNIASRRGIERVGFEPLGVYRTTLRIGQLLSSSKLLADQPTAVCNESL